MEGEGDSDGVRLKVVGSPSTMSWIDSADMGSRNRFLP